MDMIHLSDGGVSVTLSRRNIETLLKKLDFNRSLDAADPHGRSPRSDVQILRDTEAGFVIVSAHENEEHYGERVPGDMLDNATGRIDSPNRSDGGQDD